MRKNVFAVLFLLIAAAFFAASIYIAMSRPSERIETAAQPLSSSELDALVVSKIISREEIPVQAEKAASTTDKAAPRVIFPSQGTAVPKSSKKGKSAEKPEIAPKTKLSKFEIGLDGGMNRLFGSRIASEAVDYPLSMAASAPIAAPVVPPAIDPACRERMLARGFVNPEKCVDIDEVVKKLAVGTYVFNKPAKAFVGETTHIKLVLRTTPTQEVQSFFSGLPGEVGSKEGKFSQFVSASLRGDDLGVEPNGPQTRTATSEEPVEWDWVITPSAAGQKTLVIEVLAEIQAGPKQIPVTVRTLREPIIIDVSYFQRVKIYAAALNGYIVAVSAGLTALAGIFGFIPSIRGFVFGLFRRRRESPRYGR